MQQLTITQLLTLATGLAGDMSQVKSDIREMKANTRNTNASIDEILRLLRCRND